ncbi:MAG: hypothetical protein JWQ54_245 [Mucilaginibacter sp.]|nr:hypothetical protein [Mucilaginibacter sp.]
MLNYSYNQAILYQGAKIRLNNHSQYNSFNYFNWQIFKIAYTLKSRLLIKKDGFIPGCFRLVFQEIHRRPEI